jgi:LuxR family transcriptional regulator, maltose regulon positive regulatory protein
MSAGTDLIAPSGSLLSTPAGQKPRLRPGLVPRKHAVSRCLQADSSMILILAPAGYGKTTALSQWDDADPRPFQWISLDWRHNDPALFLASVAAALNEVEPLEEFVIAPLTTTNPNLELATSRICDALAERSQPLVLVLDDLHLIENPLTLRPLPPIVEAMPGGVTVALATRGQVGLPLGRLRAQHMVTDLGVADLRMSVDEAAELLGEAGLDLDRGQIEDLNEHAEGWPAGLYLAALSLSTADDVGAALSRFYGDDRLVADYLRDEFLAALPAADLGFLIRTSVLDRLSGPLCDAILDQGGCAEALRRLSRSNLLLSPLDNREHEYRCHALLREMLESELERLGRQKKSELHLRASRWYAAAGDSDRAAMQAIASGHVGGDLIWLCTPEYESSGRGATLRRWLAQFSEHQLRLSAPLCLTSAAISAGAGEGAQVEHWTTAARAALAAAPRPDSAVLEAAATLIRGAGAARDGVGKMGDDIASALELLPEDNIWRSLGFLLVGVSSHLRGDLAGGRSKLEEGARVASTGAPNVECLCRAQLALLDLEEGERESARESASRAIGIVDRFGLGNHPTQALVIATSALVKALDGQSDSAARELALVGTLLERFSDFSPWYEAETRIVLARALLLLDEVTDARERLGEAGRYLDRTPDAVVLRAWIERAWNDADASRAVTGRWPLTPAELRLLHLMPTHLTFPKIAEELFVSTNTVKTQAQSIYRKLEVASRAEAVACARSAGLLEARDRPATD